MRVRGRRRSKVDVVVVGLGAAGGTAVLPLASSGLSVVALEAGPPAPPRGQAFDELRHPGFGRDAARSKAAAELPTHRRRPEERAERRGSPALMDNALGGTLNSWAGLWYRNLDWNFRSHSRTIARYGAAAVPADSTLVDWPISYAELAPHYTKVEEMHGVSGLAAGLTGAGDRGGNVFEATREPFPLPPLRRSGWNDLMQEGARKLGWHPFPGAAAIRSQPYKEMPSCTYCGFCRGQRCYIGARAETTLTKAAERTSPGLRIETNARVLRINVDRNGTATGVTYLLRGRLHRQDASLVLIASYTYENVRLLLLSRSRAHPQGIGNDTGQVGRHFMTHSFLGVYGLFPDRRLNRFSGSQSQFTAVDDWNGDNFDHSSVGFLAGSTLVASMEEKPIALALSVPPDVPRWGAAYKHWLSRHACSVGSAFAQLDVLPYRSNYLDLDPEATDTIGQPVIRCTYDLQENEWQQAEFLLVRLEEWLSAAGAATTWRLPVRVEAVSTHAYGGTRMGEDAGSSVVDKNGFVHDTPNVAVVGASVFPTAGGHNPTATVMALAHRTAERAAAASTGSISFGARGNR
jgi:gluconate 2-dehydrogenase alpha chain